MAAMMARFVFPFPRRRGGRPDFPLRPLAAFPSLSFALSPPRVTGLGALATYCNHIGPFCFHRPTPAAHVVCMHTFDPANPSIDLDVFP